MGKEQDLLNAGKTGNVSQIEKILGQKGKKSGLHSIIVRSTNPNYQDEMGYTPLHYGSLNGHRAAVELLLKYDASANIPDHSGNFPLHLAAFNGHAEVCRVLINSGPSRAKVNEQNGTEDTAMHSAAQSKSSQVVAVLLENHADPFIRNCRKQSPLDLAAQYGRMENVKLLLSYHPNLLQNNVKTHSPLHLAARNGHIDVVSNLLGCGMSVNTECDTGTALHEAALYGKLDVCNFLLQCDVDITIKDKNQMTVMDLLMNHPSSKTKEISALIYNYTQTKRRPRSTNQGPNTGSFKEQQYSTVATPTTRASTISYRSSNYDDIPDFRLQLQGPSRRDTYDSVPTTSPSQYDNVPAPQPVPDMISKDNLAYYKIEPHTFHEPGTVPMQIPTAAQNSVPDYEILPSQTKQRGLNVSVYEVPPTPIQQPRQPSPLEQANHSEGEYGLVGATVYSPKPSKPIRQHKPDGSENPPAVSLSVYEVPPPLKQRGETERTPLGQTCPLDIPEGALGRLDHTSGNPLGPDADALATLPGYEFMGPGSSDARPQYEYEVLGPNPEGREVTSTQPTNGQYEFLSLAKTKPGRSSQSPLPQSPPVYEIAPPPILAPQEPRPAAQTKPSPGPSVYEVPPSLNLSSSQDASVYEVPPMASFSSSSSQPPIYEIAPPPRPQIPDRPPPNNVPLIGNMGENEPTHPIAPPRTRTHNSTPPNNVPLIGNMDDKEPVPPLAPRPINGYAKCPIQPTVDAASATNKPPLPPAYEKVRIEAPKGKIAVEQPIPVIPPRTYLGDYCTLDPNAVSPMNPSAAPKREDVSSGSSFGSASSSDVSEIPGIPPPSPSIAEAAVFAALETSDDPVLKAKNMDQAKEENRTLVPAPRRESLNDRPKWYTDEMEEKDLEIGQDPFSNPPTRKDGPNTSTSNDEPSTFLSLHNRFSPNGSKENLTEESTDDNTKDTTEDSEDNAPTPLIYENVLFQRSDSITRQSITKNPDTKDTESISEDMDKSKGAATNSEPSSLLDEAAEWEKIDQLLLSIGEIENIGEITDAGNSKTVPEWLNALGVGQYETEFVANGFDSLDFLNGGVLEDQDLLEIGVADLSHRKIILEAAKSLPSPPRVAKLENPPATVEEWLSLIKLQDYLQTFLHHGFANMDRVKMLWEVELTSVLEINCLGHRNRILTSLIEPRRMTMVRKSRQTEIDSKGNFGLDEKLAELSLFCPDEESASLDNSTLEKIADEMINDESLKRKTLRRKSEKMWRHEPEVLLKGSVNYTTQYLGSQTVKEIVGVSSTVDACRKMKLSTAKLQKIPSVTLAVSVNGIKFIDSRTKLVISNHKMNNVSYITQDPENRRIFAYIARDPKVDRHYCHVFRVDDLDMSDEVTMTIGQAFELAYDHFLQIQLHVKSKKT